MIKSTGLVFLSLFVFVSLADVSSGNETALHHKSRRNHKKDAKIDYYLSRHVDHAHVDAETIQKHGASLEDAKMQADGLLEPKNKKSKGIEAAGSTREEAGALLQEMAHHLTEERQHQRRRHHRHEAKVHEESKSDGSMEEVPKKESVKEKKVMNKSRKNSELGSENIKSEEVKVDGSKNAEPAKHFGGKRNHDKRKKGHKHGAPGHKNKKHGGKKSEKPSGKPKDKKDKKMRKNNHHN